MKNFAIVVAATSSTLGIGKNGKLPWKLAGDMQKFKEITTTTSSDVRRNAVIMGRKTWESLPSKFRPLPRRLNIVLSKNPSLRQELSIPEDVVIASSLDEALENVSTSFADSVENIYVIGGQAIYTEAISSPYCKEILLTSVEADFNDCDTFFPQVPAHKFRLISRSQQYIEDGIPYRFTKFESIPDTAVFESPSISSFQSSVNEEEMQYLRLIDEIIKTGICKGDRTGTGTISKFGVQMRFSLRDNVFPLLTTKKVFWRGVAEELLWFVKGCTNGKELSEKGIHIWDGNGSREFLDKLGHTDREEGDLGPVYGFQWRHFGAAYSNMYADYEGQGIDQLRECVEKIKHNPEDRRIIMTAWNPSDLGKMALPPCHMFCQFYVANGELSCQMYQRSADMGLGVPFNIASYSLLTRMVAQVCGLKAGDFVHCIGDAHVYSNHVEALTEQIARQPREFPRLVINPEITDIDGFTFSDFTIDGYKPDSTIKMKMAV